MYSGDIRRSLQITKRAVELCRETHIKKKSSDLTKVTYHHVLEAFNEMFESKTVQVLKTLKKNEVIVVLALYNEIKCQRAEKVLLDDVQDRCSTILKRLMWGSRMQTGVFREIVKRLQAFGLIQM